MKTPESIQIEAIRITLPEGDGSSVQKQTPLVPRTGKAAVTLDDIFRNANVFLEDNLHGTIFSQ